jgi:FK506-binding protein 2
LTAEAIDLVFAEVKMSYKIVLLLLACVLVAVLAKETKSKKLQIGIKKRVDNCTVKSKRGDLLHMHYTV